MRTYELHAGSMVPDGDAYSAQANAEYTSLLDSGGSEAAFQDFFERNPCFVPGAWTPGAPSGHGPLHMALISQPELPGLSSRRPDFMWIGTDSATWYPMLIEIERPDKRVFTRGGIPTSAFTQARNQLAQWRRWFSEPSNVQKFILDYGIPEIFTKFRTMQPNFILVYGRRDEFQDNVELSKQRAALFSAPDEDLVSFDRLRVDLNLRDAITVRATGNGRFAAKFVMPTLRGGPWSACRLCCVDGLEEVIRAEGRMSPERRKFMAERVPYWRAWTARPDLGIIESQDYE